MNRKLSCLTIALVLLAHFSMAAAAIGLTQNIKISSQRLTNLQKDIDNGNRAALDTFWQEVTKQGTPLVESITGDDRYVFLTFLWRAKEEIKNVVVVGGIAGYQFTENQMTHLPDTDLWYRTYRVRNDARFGYNLSPNDSLILIKDINIEDQKAVMQRMSTFKTDPLNPKTYPGLPPVSLVELPGAIPQPWINKSPETPAGKLEEKKLKSTILNNERKVWVYTPPGYNTSGPSYGLMVIFDGFAYTLLVPTPTILDNLLAKGLMPPIVAVVLDNPTPTSRNYEMPCNPKFADFLAKEVVPWMRDNYHVTKESTQTAVAGSSYGGLAATYAGFSHPEVFGNVISQSGSFWWKPKGDSEHEWLTRQFAASPVLPLRFYLDVGLLERGPTPDDGPDQVVVNRHMRDVLLAKGYQIHYREFNGGHEYLNWRGTFADALIALFGKTTTPNTSKPK